MSVIKGAPHKLADLFKKKDRNFVMVSQVIGAVIALVSGKLIAVYVSPEDFGTYGIQFATLTLFSSMLILPCIQFIKANYATLIPKLGIKPFAVVLTGVVVVSYALIAVFFNAYFGDIQWVLLLLLLLYLILNSLHMILGEYLNVQNRLIAFSKLGIVRVTVSLLFISSFFFFGLDYIDHVRALWTMQIIGALAGVLFFYRSYKINRGVVKVHFKTFFKRYFKFAWPLAFSAAWIWISNYFDRYAIEHLLSIKEVGIYSASYGVGSKFFLVISPVFVVLSTPVVFSNSKREVKKRSLRTYGLYYSLIALPSLVLIYFFREFIGRILLSEDYATGFFLIFWIALAFFLITLAQLFELYFYSEKRTRVILISNIASALFNITINLLLIPTYGIFGAALATCGGFAAYFITIYLFFIRKDPGDKALGNSVLLQNINSNKQDR